MLRKIVISSLVIIVALLAAYFLYRYSLFKESIETISAIPGLTLTDINYVKNVHGTPVWNLRVKSAVKDDSTGTVKGTGIGLTVFQKGRPKAFLTAQHGEADIRTGRLRVWGDVILRLQGGNCTVSAKEIAYYEKRKEMVSKGPVEFLCIGLNLRGNHMVVHLKDKSLEIQGLVSATAE